MNNSVKALIVISFNEGRQGLLERHVTLGWGGLQCCERGGGVGELGYLQKRELSLKQKNNM